MNDAKYQLLSEERRKKAKLKYEADIEKRREYARNWYHANSEKRRKKAKLRYEADIEKRREYARNWYHANRERLCVQRRANAKTKRISKVAIPRPNRRAEEQKKKKEFTVKRTSVVLDFT